jgi:dUTP pyrophosphatase
VSSSIISIPISLNQGSKKPSYAKTGDAGMDLSASLETESITIEPGQRFLVPTGIVIAIPEGYEGQIRPRSGLALKYGLTVLNSPGTIDSGYRGEIKVIMINLGQETVKISHQDRIAQLVIHKLHTVHWVEKEIQTLGTERGQEGFGSSG